MTSQTSVVLFVAFFAKHFICDFPLQGPYQYKNKGTIGHPGGFLHAAIQGLGTVIVLVHFGAGLEMLRLVFVFEFILHYLIDWAKMNINRFYNLKPDNSEQFWWLLGFDQFLHYLTYAGIVYLMILQGR